VPKTAPSGADEQLAGDRRWRKGLDFADETSEREPIPLWLTRLNRFSPGGAIAISMAIAIAIGEIDYVTGPRVTLSVFYLVPTCCLTWRLGFRAGVFLAGFAAALAFVADAASGGGSLDMGFPYWNFLARLLMLVFVVYILSMLQQLVRHERESHRKDEEARTRLRRWTPRS
jgi:hypothetical protein